MTTENISTHSGIKVIDTVGFFVVFSKVLHEQLLKFLLIVLIWFGTAAARPMNWA